MSRFKFIRNVKSIWESSTVGWHLVFTYFCFVSILMIPIWFYFYISSFLNWFNNHHANRIERINREQDYYYSWKLVKYMQENGNLPKEKVWLMGTHPEHYIPRNKSNI